MVKNSGNLHHDESQPHYEILMNRNSVSINAATDFCGTYHRIMKFMPYLSNNAMNCAISCHHGWIGRNHPGEDDT